MWGVWGGKGERVCHVSDTTSVEELHKQDYNISLHHDVIIIS